MKDRLQSSKRGGGETNRGAMIQEGGDMVLMEAMRCSRLQIHVQIVLLYSVPGLKSRALVLHWDHKRYHFLRSIKLLGVGE